MMSNYADRIIIIFFFIKGGYRGKNLFSYPPLNPTASIHAHHCVFHTIRLDIRVRRREGILNRLQRFGDGR